MAKHPVKMHGNSLSPQILIAIDKSTSKNKHRPENGIGKDRV
jgi:hypothetical protein